MTTLLDTTPSGLFVPSGWASSQVTAPAELILSALVEPPAEADGYSVTTDDTRKLAEKYLQEKRRIGRITHATVKDQRQILRAFAALTPNATRINKRAVMKWLDSIEHVAPATRRSRYSTVRGFCRWLLHKGIVKKDPCADIPSPKVPRPVARVLSDAQAAALVAACEDETDLLIIALGFDMGLRRAEMAALELGDIALSDHPTMTVTGKGGHRRELPIPKATYAVLNRYLAVHQVTAGPLIRLRRYPERGVQPVWIGRRFTELAYRAGIKSKTRDGVSHHAMRRSLATKLWVLTGDVILVADVLGHADLGQLRHYVRSMDTERMRDALEAGRLKPDKEAPPSGPVDSEMARAWAEMGTTCWPWGRLLGDETRDPRPSAGE